MSIAKRRKIAKKAFGFSSLVVRKLSPDDLVFYYSDFGGSNFVTPFSSPNKKTKS